MVPLCKATLVFLAYFVFPAAAAPCPATTTTIPVTPFECPSTQVKTTTVAANSKRELQLVEADCNQSRLAVQAQVQIQRPGGVVSLVDIYDYARRVESSVDVVQPHALDPTAGDPSCNLTERGYEPDSSRWVAPMTNGSIMVIYSRNCSSATYVAIVLDRAGKQLSATPLNNTFYSSRWPERVTLALSTSDGMYAIAWLVSKSGWVNVTFHGSTSAPALSFNTTSDDADASIDMTTLNDGRMVLTFCDAENKRQFYEVYPNVQKIFSWSYCFLESNYFAAVRLFAAHGQSRMWILAGRKSSDFEGQLEPAGYDVRNVIAATLLDVDSAIVLQDEVLAQSYPKLDCLDLAVAPDGYTFFGYEIGGADAMGIAIADPQGSISFSNRNVWQTEPDNCAVAAYDDNSFGLFMSESETLSTWALYYDRSGFQLSDFVQSSDQFAPRYKPIFAFSDGNKTTIVATQYELPTEDNEVNNVLALNVYRGYLALEQNTASSTVTVENYSPKPQSIVLTAFMK